MPMLITLLTVLSLSIVGLPGLASASQAAVASTATPPSGAHHAQGRKKKRGRPIKARNGEKKAAKKIDKKPKKNDRGFEL